MTNGKRITAEAWWPLLRDMGSFILGSGLLITQALHDHSDPVVVGAGLALIGVTATGRIQQYVKKQAENGSGAE